MRCSCSKQLPFCWLQEGSLQGGKEHSLIGLGDMCDIAYIVRVFCLRRDCDPATEAEVAFMLLIPSL